MRRMMNIIRHITLFMALCAVLPRMVMAAESASAPADPHDLSGIWMNDNTLDEIGRAHV